jgi:hypothetical protein
MSKNFDDSEPEQKKNKNNNKTFIITIRKMTKEDLNSIGPEMDCV